MALPKEDIYTIEDIYALPDGERAELIDGQIYYMAPPSTKHQRVSNYIPTEINLFIRMKGASVRYFRHRLQYTLMNLQIPTLNQIFLSSVTRIN